MSQAQPALFDDLGGSLGYGTECLTPNDDSSSAAIDLRPAFPSGLLFFGSRHTQVYVNTNGNITFGGALSDFTPDPFPVADQPMIAPYWADIDIRSAAGCSSGTGSGECQNPSENGVWWHLEPGRMVITWDRVGYFRCHDDLRMTFQLILAEPQLCDAPGDFDVEFRYTQCEWETGDVGSGEDGFGGAEAQVGFDAGNTVDFVSIMGSMEPGISRIVCEESNVGEAGLWRFRIHDGTVECPDAGVGCDTGLLGVCAEGRGQCVGTGSQCEQVIEAADERCDAFDNDCDGETDEGDNLCPESQLCERGRCIDQCFEGGCGEGEFCADDGVCRESACQDVACDEGERCLQGHCVSVCEGVQCPQGLTCRAGRCLDLCESVTCPSCNVCVDGRCGVHCAVSGCPQDQACEENGRCVEEQCLGVRCGPGRNCSGGVCVDTCQDVTCPQAQTCYLGECIPEGNVPDAGPVSVAEQDAGPLADGAMTMDGGADAGDGVPPIGDGCSCRIGQAQNDSPMAWLSLLLALGGLALMRRRRRGRSAISHRAVSHRASGALIVVGGLALAGLLQACGTPEGCGDGRLLLPETCDDSNTAAGDGCSSSCLVEEGYLCAGIPSVCSPGVAECGNVLVEGEEECDEGRQSVACDGDCTRPRCGDGWVNELIDETCDDGNTEALDGCSPTCEIEPNTCGNGICEIDAEETCRNCASDCAETAACRDCPDVDGDSYRDSACGGADCNDRESQVHPGLTEISCNGIDEDCDPSTPDALDEDGDLSSCNFDCDDHDATRSPLITEICGNEIDDDCDVRTEDVGDNDEDGFDCMSDCDDRAASIHPGADEICGNFFDDDCDPATSDSGDFDDDGYLCDVDCDDGNPDVHPGATEICNNGIDDDCNADSGDLQDGDLDGDSCATDCDDADPRRASTIVEICGNLIDDDCDESTLDRQDVDMDTFTCDVDCDDADPLVFPDTLGICGERFLYLEDFESGDGGWTTEAGINDLDETSPTVSWQHGVPNHPITAPLTEPYIDAAASGTQAWVTNLDGDYPDLERSYLTSPSFDFTGVQTDPYFSANMTFALEALYDSVWIEISVAGGAFRKLGAAGEGRLWYAWESEQAWTGQSGPPGVWHQVGHVLDGSAGANDVRIRFAFDSDRSSPMSDPRAADEIYEGVGIDDVMIDSQMVDLGLASIDMSDTCATASHPVALTISNSGLIPVAGYDVSYQLDDGAIITEQVTAAVLPGSTSTYTFSTPADLSAPGNHHIDAWVSAPGDILANDDRGAVDFSVAGIFSLSSGYSEDFETSGGGWVVSGQNPSWEHGIPDASFIDAASSGMRAWVTNLDGLYNGDEHSYLSACFDMSATTRDPTLSFSHIFQTAGTCCDQGWMEIKIGPNGEWTRLGTSESGQHWYNDEARNWWDSVSGARHVWWPASHPLTGAAGQSMVNIRFVVDTNAAGSYEGFGVDELRITP